MSQITSSKISSLPIKPEDINYYWEQWRTAYAWIDNKAIVVKNFILGQHIQNPRSVINDMQEGREHLTVNFVESLFSQLRAEQRLIEYNVKADSFSVSDEAELVQGQRVIEEITIKNESFRNVINLCFDDIFRSLYGTCLVYEDYIDEYSDLKIPQLKYLQPDHTFFDKNAKQLHKGDGRYCGYIENISKQELRTRYKSYTTPSIPTMQWALERENLVHFFIKIEEKVRIYKIGEEYIPEHRLLPEELNLLQETTALGELNETNSRIMDTIYECVFIKDSQKFLIPPKRTKLNKLPIIYFGESGYIPYYQGMNNTVVDITTGDDNNYYFQAPCYLGTGISLNQIYNYNISRLVEQIKMKTGGFMVAKESLDSQSVTSIKMGSDNILQYNAFAPDGRPVNHPIKIEPVKLDDQMLILKNSLSNELQSLYGNLSNDNQQNNDQSGVALAIRGSQIDLRQKDKMAIFLESLNRCGEVMRDMYLNLSGIHKVIVNGTEIQVTGRLSYIAKQQIEQERQTILSQAQSPEQQAEIYKTLPKIVSFMDLYKNYRFSIVAKPSTQLERMQMNETAKEILSLSPNIPDQFKPQLFSLIGGNLGQELSSIASATMVIPQFGQELAQVANGNMTPIKYAEELNKKNAERAKMQQEAEAQNPVILLETQKHNDSIRIKDEEIKLEQQKLNLEQQKLNNSSERDMEELSIQRIVAEEKLVKIKSDNATSPES